MQKITYLNLQYAGLCPCFRDNMEGHNGMYMNTQLGTEIKLNKCLCGHVHLLLHLGSSTDTCRVIFLVQPTVFQSTWIRLLLILQHSGWSLDMETSNPKGSINYQVSEVWEIPQEGASFSFSKQCHWCWLHTYRFFFLFFTVGTWKIYNKHPHNISDRNI